MDVITLSDLKVGNKCIVDTLLSSGNERRRMLDLGIVPNTNIEALYKSPAGDPVAYFIRGAVIALRSEDAKKILISNIN